MTRNPETVKRITGRLQELSLDKIHRRATEPKETNRRIGPLFKNWVESGSHGLPILKSDKFSKTNSDGIMQGSDAVLKSFASEQLGYTGDKGLDIIVRIDNRYIIGEAKFLTDYGGHQYAQLRYALALFDLPNLKVVPVAILDGVLYNNSNTRMHKQITSAYSEKNIMSALLLKEFIHSF